MPEASIPVDVDETGRTLDDYIAAGQLPRFAGRAGAEYVVRHAETAGEGWYEIRRETMMSSHVSGSKSTLEEAFAHAELLAELDRRPIHLQTGSSSVRCGAPMRDAEHPLGWDLSNVSVSSATCADCLEGRSAR